MRQVKMSLLRQYEHVFYITCIIHVWEIIWAELLCTSVQQAHTTGGKLQMMCTPLLGIA